MATKKAAVTTGSSTSTALTKWEEKLAAKAVEAVAATQVSGKNVISIRNGVMSMHDKPLPGSKIQGVILDHILVKAFYQGTFDPKSPSSPVCFAFGRKEEGMEPHPKSTNKQNADCATCPNNQYGTADVGKGKACKDQRRLDIVPENNLVSIKTAESAYLHIPPTSLKAYDDVVRDLADTFKRSPIGMVVEVSSRPDPERQLVIETRVIGKLEDSRFFGKGEADFENVFARGEKSEANIMWAYEASVTNTAAKTSNTPAKERKFSKTPAKVPAKNTRGK